MDGTIHRFEFTFELFWKTSRRFLQQEGIDTASPKSTYNAKMAREIFGRCHRTIASYVTASSS